RLADLAAGQESIQSFQMLDVCCEVVQKHDIEEHSHDLRQRRISLIRRFLLVFQIVAADADSKNLFGPQPYDRAERLLKSNTTIAKESRSPRRFKSYRLKDQRDSRR